MKINNNLFDTVTALVQGQKRLTISQKLIVIKMVVVLCSE